MKPRLEHKNSGAIQTVELNRERARDEARAKLYQDAAAQLGHDKPPCASQASMRLADWLTTGPSSGKPVSSFCAPISQQTDNQQTPMKDYQQTDNQQTMTSQFVSRYRG